MSLTIILLIIALAIIAILFWFFRCDSSNSCCKSTETPETQQSTTEEISTSEPTSSTGGSKPAAMEKPSGEADDLKKISGVGPKIEQILNELGIFHYSQVAEFTDDNIEWVDEKLQFKGRIQRDDWVGQAKKLAEDN